MAYGSVTVPVRTKTKTTTKTQTKTSSSTSSTTTTAVASTSRLAAPPPGRRLSESQDDRPGSSEDDDPDFGTAARRAVAKEVKRDRKAEEERNTSAKGKGKGKRGGKAVAKVESSASEEEKKPVLKKRVKKAPAHVVGWQGSSSDEDDDDEEEEQPERKVGKKTASKESKGGYKRRKRVGGGVEERESMSVVVKKHLKGLWRSRWQRYNAEYMSVGRRWLEEKYNPLIGLLDIKIQIIDSDEERGESVHWVLEDAGTDLDSSSDDDSDSSMAIYCPTRPVSDFDATMGDLDSEPEEPPTENEESFNTLVSIDSDDEDVKPVLPPRPALLPLPPPDDDASDPEPDTEDDDEEEVKAQDADDEEPEDAWLKRSNAARDEKEAKIAKERAEAAAREKKAALELKIKILREARELEQAEKAAAAAEQDAMDEDEEPDLSYVEQNRRDSQLPQTIYPYTVRKGRPKFKIMNRQQDSIGAYVLAPGVEIPAPINKFLRKYQREGVEFMYRQYKAGVGGILGDDMGLGKTIQVIAFLSAIMGKTGLKKHDVGRRKNAITDLPKGSDFPTPSTHGPTVFIACPATVVHNWAREFKTWGYFDVAVYEGSDRKSILKQFERGYLDVVLAGIEATRINIGELSQQDFTIVIVDEAHRVKNPLSATTKALHLFPSKLRYGLTGTAIQNRLEEFWCILNWSNPGKVGVLGSWSLYVSRPLKYAQKVDADNAVLARGRIRALALVQKLLPNFWIRRTKDTVKLQLPKKTDRIVLCPLTDLQKKVYKKMLSLDDVNRILTHDDPCPCGAVDQDGRPYTRKNCCDPLWFKLILPYITLFQKISNHLSLIYPDKEELDTHPDKYHKDLEWARAAFPDDFNKRKRGALTTLDPSLCGKWPVLKQLLDLWYSQGDKVLIFSLSLKILELVKDLMSQTQYPFVCLDGSVPNDQRMDLVDAFNNDENMFCFLISTKAGGVGLNLTAANRVVIFDPNWNPSHDLQAMDRAYRFGQTRNVDVYRLIGAGTLEELIYNRQQYKRAQAGLGYDANSERRAYTGVEGEKDDRGELFGVKNIFKFQEHSSLTEQSIQACNMAELEYTLKNTVIAAPKPKPGKKTSKKDTWDTEDDDEDVGVIDDEEIIKGLVAVDDPESGQSQIAARQKTEQDAIAQILANSNVTFSVVSDATLGGSRAEIDCSRKAIEDARASKRKDATGSGKVKTEKAPPKAVIASASASAASDWDPTRRRVGKAKALPLPPRAAPPPVAPSSKAARDFPSIAASIGISADVSMAELIEPSGYLGSKGSQRLVAELEALRRTPGAYEGRIRDILQCYLEEKK